MNKSTNDPALPPARTLLRLLEAQGHRAAKHLGQHFLADEDLLREIADAAGADARTLVVEIGPGPATLTTLLAERAGRLLAVEADASLEGFHRKLFAGRERIEFLYRDALRVDLWRLARETCAEWGLSRMVLAGNLPFQITSPLLFGQTGPEAPWAGMDLMVQREVADRIVAPPGGKTYGILTVKLAFWWRVIRRIEISANCFRPRPKVDASALIFEPAPASAQPPLEMWPGFSRFVDSAFNQRRKKLYNSLAETWKPAPDKSRIREAMEEIGASPDARAEDLSPEQLFAMFKALTPAALDPNEL